MRTLPLIFRITTILLLNTCLLHAADQEVKLSVAANRMSLFADENVLLTVSITGANPSENPDLSKIKGCQVELVDSRSSSFTQIGLANGRRSLVRHMGRDYVYRLTPNAAGSFTAGPVTITINGIVYTATGPEIKVTGIEKQDSVILQVIPSRETVLVDEPFEITINIAVRSLPPPYAEYDPFLPDDPPHLSSMPLAPEVPDGLTSPDIRSILQPLVVDDGKPGYSLNNYVTQNDPFDFEQMFLFDKRMKSGQVRFLFPRRNITTNGTAYIEYSITRLYTPAAEGIYTFDASTFKGSILTGITQDKQPMLRQIFAVGPAAVVRVVPPPENGRPDSFIGAVGTNFSVEASLDTYACKLGDALTLTLNYSGNVNLNNAFPPVFTNQTKLTELFRLYDDTMQVERKPGTFSSRITIRPMQAGTLEVPAMDIAYYDTAERRYRTVKTAPVPVRVDQTKEVTANIIIDTVDRNNGQGAGQPMDILENYAAPLDPDIGDHQAEDISVTGRRLILLAVGPIIYIAFILLRVAARQARRHRHASRKRRAVSRATSILAHARSSQNAGTRASALICDAIRCYISDRLSAHGAGLTPADMYKSLRNAGVPADTAQALQSVMERHFNAGFSTLTGSAANPDADAETARTLIRKIETAIRHAETRKEDGQ